MKTAEELKENDPMFDMVVERGYVPKTCLLPGMMVLHITNAEGDACKRCNHDRAVCGGRPKK